MTATLLPQGKQYFEKSDGTPGAGWKLWTMAAGTSTLKATYSDLGGTVPNTNPVVMDSRGEALIFWDGSYKARLEDDFGNPIWTVDGIEGADVAISSLIADLADHVSNVLGAHMIGYEGGTTIYDKLHRVLSMVDDFGAIGDNVADDTTAVLNAWRSGRRVEGHGLTYKCTVSITGGISGSGIQNATLDFSTSTIDHLPLLFAGGSLGATNALTSDSLRLTAVVKIASTTSYAVDQLIWVASSSVWDGSTATVYGQYGRIKSVDSSTQITLYQNLLLDFNVVDGATIAPVTTVDHLALHRVKLIGAQSHTQQGFRSEYTLDLRVSECQFDNIDYAQCVIYRGYGARVKSSSFRFARLAGLAYGVTVWGGCYDTVVSYSSGEDLRHTVTIGDNDGVNMFTKVVGCHATGSKDAGFDSHAASMFTEFIGNSVQMSAARFGTSNHDGMIIQGAYAKFIGNTVVGCKTSGIHYQPTFQGAFDTTVDVVDNTVIVDDIGTGTSSCSGLFIDNNATWGNSISGGRISGNSVSGGANNVSGVFHVNLQINCPGTFFKGLSISDNRSVDLANSYALYMRALAAGSKFFDISISNNKFRTSFTRAIFLQCDGAGSSFNFCTGGGNILEGGSTCSLQLSGVAAAFNSFRWTKNIYKSAVALPSPRIITDGTELDCLFDDNEVDICRTISAPAVTITRLTDTWVFDRAGTTTVTMPAAAACPGRRLWFRTIQAQLVISAASDVSPITSQTAGTAILPATDGAWAVLVSDGTIWQIQQSS